jgi:hypothetical protein
MAALRLTLATFFSGAYQQAVAHHVSGKYGGWTAPRHQELEVRFGADSVCLTPDSRRFPWVRKESPCDPERTSVVEWLRPLGRP